jgi:hypothetical protein
VTPVTTSNASYPGVSEAEGLLLTDDDTLALGLFEIEADGLLEIELEILAEGLLLLEADGEFDTEAEIEVDGLFDILVLGDEDGSLTIRGNVNRL